MMFRLDGSEISWLVYADWLEDQDKDGQVVRDSLNELKLAGYDDLEIFQTADMLGSVASFFTAWAVYADWLEDQDKDASFVRQMIYEDFEEKHYDNHDGLNLHRVGGRSYEDVGTMLFNLVGQCRNNNVGSHYDKNFASLVGSARYDYSLSPALGNSVGCNAY